MKIQCLNKFFKTAAITLLCATSAAPSFAETGLSTSGSAVIVVEADQASIFLTLRAEGKTPEEAINSIRSLEFKLREMLKAEPVQNRDIVVGRFSLTPKTVAQKAAKDGSKQPDLIVGHIAESDARIKLSNLIRIESILRKISETGEFNIRNVQFKSSKIEAATFEAKQRAIADALSNAKMYGNALDIKIGSAFYIEDKPCREINEEQEPDLRYIRHSDSKEGDASIFIKCETSIKFRLD